MNRKILKGEWEQLSGTIQDKWSKLTDEDLESIAGKYDELVGKLQEYYNYTKEEAEEKLNRFQQQLSEKFSEASSTLRHQGEQVNEFAHRSPWATAGIAALGGLILGLVLSKL